MLYGCGASGLKSPLAAFVCARDALAPNCRRVRAHLPLPI
jgi:hypothetical protein